MDLDPARAFGQTGRYVAILTFMVAWVGFAIMGMHSNAAARLFLTGMAVAVAILFVLLIST
ncbi:hypothetical protein JNW90_14935 [Micromonospora sp. STR1s_5]|nr:hypothetical protein [Micromonospora sp. STR1s_5]